MKFSAVIASIFMAGPALASPTIEPIYPRAFYIMAVQPSWPLHSDFVAAANMGLLLGLPNQNATCKETGCQVEKNRATFYIEDSSLYLYSDDKKPQMVFVDRSGMGQGIMLYSDSDTNMSPNAEVNGWSIDATGALVFAGTNVQACPGSIDGAWQVWLAGVQNPGGNKGCLGFVAHMVPVDHPVSCRYSEVVVS